MSSDAQIPVDGTAAVQANLRPGFFRSFLGVWTFEWQSRMTWGKLWTVAMSIFALPALMLLTMPHGSVDTFCHWAVTFYLLLVIPLNCLSFFGPMIRDDVQADTLPFVITRPLKRRTFYVLKYLCVMIWTQMVSFLGCVLFILVALLKGIPEIGQLMPYYFLAQFVAVVAFGALGGLMGLLSKKYMVLGVVYGFVVEWGIGSIPTNIHSLAVSFHIKSILANVPFMQKEFGWTAAAVGESTLYAMSAAAVFLILGAIMFSIREFHHAEEMQK